MTSRAFAPPGSLRNRGPVVGLGVLLLLLLACVPLAMALDEEVDRSRRMFQDREEMAWLQHQHLSAGGEIRTGVVGPGETLELGEREFTPGDGITVEVTSEAEGEYCVRATTEEGQATRWTCHDLRNPPARPTGDPLAEL